MHAHKMPTTVQFLAVEFECEMALGQAFVWIVFRLPMPTIPDHDRPAAIFALRNRAFEFVVGDRMILNLDRKPLLAGHKLRSARYRPTFHDAIEFEPQIVVETSRRVFLYDERVTTLSRHLAFWLGGYAEPAFGLIRLQTLFFFGDA